MTQLSDNLKRLMREHRLNPNSLAKESGAKQSTVFRILEGMSKSPRDDTLLPLARFFGISVEQLRYGPIAGDNVKPAHQGGTKLCPLISYVQAGELSEAVDMYAKGYAEEWIEAPAGVGECAFWLEVVGDSMTAPQGISIPEGMFILVDPEKEARNGSLVVAKVGEDVTFKKLVMDAGRYYLKPLNPSYPVIELTDLCHIVGPVIEAKYRF